MYVMGLHSGGVQTLVTLNQGSPTWSPGSPSSPQVLLKVPVQCILQVKLVNERVKKLYCYCVFVDGQM